MVHQITMKLYIILEFLWDYLALIYFLFVVKLDIKNVRKLFRIDLKEKREARTESYFPGITILQIRAIALSVASQLFVIIVRHSR